MEFHQLTVDRLKPTPGKQVDYFDAHKNANGLVLRVNPGGSKTWRVVYYVKRKSKMATLGRLEKLSLKEARARAKAFDPEKHEDAKAEAQRRAAAATFKDVADDFLEQYVVAKRLRSESEIRRLLNKLVIPRWKNRPFTTLTHDDVKTLLNTIERQRGLRTRDNVLAIIRKMMNWYSEEFSAYTSPLLLQRIKSKRSPSDFARSRVLDEDRHGPEAPWVEIPALWKACDAAGTFGALCKVLLLTGQRRAKVATMKWGDLKDGVWNIETEDRKREKGNADLLVLPPMVLDIINKQTKIDGNPYVFTADRGDGPINSFSQRKDELDAALKKILPGMKPWVLHDLRRTARTLMSRVGIRPDVSERVLGHKQQGVVGVYDRFDYREEKADALKRLAALVETIVNPRAGNVIVMADRKPRKKIARVARIR
jgi:integrase